MNNTAPACFAQPTFEVGQAVMISIPGMAPIIGSYKGHDFASIVIGMPCNISIQPLPPSPQNPQGSINFNLQPFGVPFMPGRKERKFPFTGILQVDLVGDQQLAEAYYNAFSAIKPAKANALDILDARKSDANTRPKFT